MRKIFFLSLTFFLLMVVLSGCLFKSKPKEEDSNKPILEYKQSLESVISDSNQLLERYNQGIDKLYTEEYSPEQFSTIVREIISSSSKILNSANNFDAPTELYEFHQKTIEYLNLQHQLFLNSIEEANNADNQQINKATLRSEYLAVKKKQAELLLEWKKFEQPVSSNKQQLIPGTK